jgi:glycerol-3-phosphate dehydrogenase (NAD(P)+)
MLGILGAGSWGTALGLLAANNNQPTLLWEHDPAVARQLEKDRQNERFLPGIAFPEQLQITDDLDRCISECSEIVVVVPSVAFRSVLQSIAPRLSAEQGLAWASKGLDQDNGQLLNQVAEDILGDDFPLAVISGPSFAHEVALKKPTAVSLASNSDDLAQRLIHLLHNEHFRLYTADDLTGVCLGGSYKNVLAIAAGISDGLELGFNARAALITRGLAEMLRLGLAMGGKTETFMGLAGMGDLVLTCTGDLSRNRRLGLALARGQTVEEILIDLGQVAEGLETARVVNKLAAKYEVELPIAEEVYRILFEKHSAKQAVHELLARVPTHEF